MPKKLDLVVLASDTIEQWGERFAFDYSTLRVKERVPLDYQHYDDVIVGYAEKFQFSDEKVAASAVLLSDDDSPSARAQEIAYGLDHGVPYETSCLIDLVDSDAVFIKDKEKVNVNGRELTGPLTLFSNAEIRGVAICPHGADSLTSATLALSAGGVMFYKKGKAMSIEDLKTDELLKLKKVALDGDGEGSGSGSGSGDGEGSGSGSGDDDAGDDSAEENANGGTKKKKKAPKVDLCGDVAADGSRYRADGSVVAPVGRLSNDNAKVGRQLDLELSAFVDEFGAEKGLEFYRSGKSLADARLESLRLAKELADSEIVALQAKVKELEAKVAELSAPRVGDPVGVSENAPKTVEQADPLKALAAKYKKNGVVKLQ